MALHPDVSTGKIFEYLAVAGDVWSIGPFENKGPKRVLKEKKVGKILGDNKQLIVQEIELAFYKKINGQLQRPVCIRYFPDIDRELIANRLLEHVRA